MLLVSGCGNTSSDNSDSAKLDNSSDISFDNSSDASYDNQVKIIVPDGTPALSLANFYANNESMYSTLDIVSGSRPLLAAFGSASYDIIVAPTNLGAKFYNKNEGEKYLLYQTVVWGNLYVVCNEEISSFGDLKDKKVIMFGEESTPDIVMKSLAQYYNINLNIYEGAYQSDVQTATSKYIALENKENVCVVTAQPVLSKLSNKLGNNILDLQEEWAKMTGSYSYPQASIFVKESLKGKIDNILKAMVDSIKSIENNVALTAENAMNMYDSFKSMGKEVLENAIPKCHFGIDENQKDAINAYFTKMSDLGFAKQYGEILPDEKFYYSI